MLEANFEVFQFTGSVVRLTLLSAITGCNGTGAFGRQALSYAIQQEGFVASNTPAK
jgi:hypothetical protein